MSQTSILVHGKFGDRLFCGRNYVRPSVAQRPAEITCGACLRAVSPNPNKPRKVAVSTPPEPQGPEDFTPFEGACVTTGIREEVCRISELLDREWSKDSQPHLQNLRTLREGLMALLLTLPYDCDWKKTDLHPWTQAKLKSTEKRKSSRGLV